MNLLIDEKIHKVSIKTEVAELLDTRAEFRLPGHWRVGYSHRWRNRWSRMDLGPPTFISGGTGSSTFEC